MLRVKRQLGLTNLEVGGELELLDANDEEASVQGRIDIVLRFLHQFGDEEAYVGVECKRVRPGDSSLNARYVTQGVDRFAAGQYAAGHLLGMMLGYVLQLPLGALAADIDARMRKRYGEAAKLGDMDAHVDALSMQFGNLAQGAAGHIIRLIHIFVDMSPASSATSSTVAPS